MTLSSIAIRKTNDSIFPTTTKQLFCNAGVCSYTWPPGHEVAMFSNILLSYITWHKPLSSHAHRYAQFPGLVCISSDLWVNKFWWNCSSAWLLLNPLLAPAVVPSFSIASNTGGFMPGNCNCQCQGSAPRPLVFVTSSHSWLASIYSILSVYNQLETFFCTKFASLCDPSNLYLK